MVDVHERSFGQWLPVVESAIRDSSFVTFDFEFLGLLSNVHPKVVTLFDSPGERYVKLKDSVRRFPPCQLGLACFKEVDGGYEVEVFCISLFKRLAKRVFSFSLGAMSFLAQHNFDFNKFVRDGVSYCNKAELADLKKSILGGDIDYDTFTDGLDHRLLMLKARILMECDVQEEDMSTVRLGQPILLELVQKDGDEESDADISEQDRLWERPLTSIEAAIVVYVLSEEYHYFDFQLDHSRTLLYVAERPLIFRSNSDRKRSNRNLFKCVLNELSGVSAIFNALSERKAVIIGHNSLLDLMYLFNYFNDDLPESYEEFKTTVTSHFPHVFDTKVLAGSLQDKLSEYGVSDFSLQTLGNFFDSPSCGSVLPFDLPEVHAGKHSGGVFDEAEHYHNAAYDALITGEVFIRLANLYCFARCTNSAMLREAWPLRKILIVLRSKIGYKIPIPLVDAQYCFLNGDDPPGFRPDLIRIRQIPHWEWIYQKTNVETIHSIADRIYRYLVPPHKFTSYDATKLNDELARTLGTFRVDVRLEDNQSTLVIATNTANTYARVCSFFQNHDDYSIVDENNSPITKSFEQRLTSHRHEKNEAIHAQKMTLFSRKWMIGVPVLCTAILVSLRILKNSQL